MSMSELVRVLLLAVIQGIAEFLPVSSSGHIVVLDELLKRSLGDLGHAQENVMLNVTLHLGTLGAILVVYRKDLWGIWRRPRLCLQLILATIPAGVIGVVYKKQIEATFENPLMVACGWTVAAGLMWFSQRVGRGQRNLESLNEIDAWVIGLFQAVALVLRGASRSGSTISGGLFMGLKREDAAAFSFFAAIPAIGGAVAMKALPLVKHLVRGSDSSAAAAGDPFGGYSPLVLLIGALVSFAVGLVSLRWLLKIITTRGLDWFVYYLLTVAALTFAWQAYEFYAPAP